MKVVLKEDINGTGKKDDVCCVSDGYARNYLFPRKLAVEASPAALNDVKNKEQAIKHKREQELKTAEQQGQKLFSKTIEVAVRCAPNGKIYGAVTAKDVAMAIKEQHNIDVDKRKISLSDIKELGSYEATVKICTTVSGNITVAVKAK